MRKICIFTGTRAEYGLLRPVITRLAALPGVEATLLVTGAHLSAEHGETAREIDQTGIAAVAPVPILDGDESDVGIAGAMARGLKGYAEALVRLRPDILLILGDRYEALAAAAAATVCRVPIAHLHGGESTLGAMDDAFRHAITKMAHLHFASTEIYRSRIIAMGETPDRVFNVGALGVENALRLPLLQRTEVEARLGLPPGQRFALMTYHPETLDGTGEPEAEARDILDALAEHPDLVTVVTGANADAGGRRINAALEAAAAADPTKVIFRMSLGSVLYLSSLKLCEVVIGNSSSGVIEAGSFKVPVVDIGTRQAGRIRGANVVHCAPGRAAIAAALSTALSPDFRRSVALADNPYGKPDTAEAIVRVLLDWPLERILYKEFFDAPKISGAKSY